MLRPPRSRRPPGTASSRHPPPPAAWSQAAHPTEASGRRHGRTLRPGPRGCKTAQAAAGGQCARSFGGKGAGRKGRYFIRARSLTYHGGDGGGGRQGMEGEARAHPHVHTRTPHACTCTPAGRASGAGGEGHSRRHAHKAQGPLGNVVLASSHRQFLLTLPLPPLPC